MRERDLRIDLIKLIATAMVVILHTVENGGGTTQCLYLLGAFGIPLFLTVNGYLMYDKDINFLYFSKKFAGYFRFVLLWSVVIGAAESVRKGRFVLFNVFLGAWLGKGPLLHLWFITTILLVLGLNCLFGRISKQSGNKHALFTTKWMITLVILMNLLFVFNTFFINTGDVVIAPFRLLTNGGYYLLGMHLHSRNMNLKPCHLVLISVAGYVGICLLSIMLSIKWASAMYASIFCIMGVSAIVIFCLNLKVSESLFWRMVHYAAPTSVGIWVTHPFAIAVLQKMLALAGGHLTLVLRALMVPVVFAGCMIISKTALQMKGIRMLFRI